MAMGYAEKLRNWFSWSSHVRLMCFAPPLTVYVTTIFCWTENEKEPWRNLSVSGKTLVGQEDKLLLSCYVQHDAGVAIKQNNKSYSFINNKHFYELYTVCMNDSQYYIITLI